MGIACNNKEAYLWISAFYSWFNLQWDREEKEELSKCGAVEEMWVTDARVALGTLHTVLGLVELFLKGFFFFEQWCVIKAIHKKE